MKARLKRLERQVKVNRHGGCPACGAARPSAPLWFLPAHETLPPVRCTRCGQELPEDGSVRAYVVLDAERKQAPPGTLVVKCLGGDLRMADL